MEGILKFKKMSRGVKGEMKVCEKRKGKKAKK
jgi:hypothetical protein